MVVARAWKRSVIVPGRYGLCPRRNERERREERGERRYNNKTHKSARILGKKHGGVEGYGNKVGVVLIGA
jgi:hypothetical protein